MAASITGHTLGNCKPKIDKRLTVVKADIHSGISGSQGLIMIRDLYIMEKPVDLAIPFCDFSDSARKFRSFVLAHRIVLALRFIDCQDRSILGRRSYVHSCVG
jgi:hypothetical protein